MTPRTRSRACTTAAVLLLACAILTTNQQPLYALPELAAACLLHQAGRTQQRRHDTAQAAERAARPIPDPEPTPPADHVWDGIIRAYHQPAHDPRNST